MAREERNTIGYTVALISEFAHHFGISSRQAYTYLKRFKGMEHLYNHYVVLHTQSFPDTIDALAQVCTNNGGELKFSKGITFQYYFGTQKALSQLKKV